MTIPNRPTDQNALPPAGEVPTIPTTFTRFRLAFYTRPIGIFGWLTKLFTGTPVHVELVFNDFLIYSAATKADGSVGTRFKIQQGFPPPNWLFVELDPKYASAAFQFAYTEQGDPYDYWGLLFGWSYNYRPSPTRWYCSEVVSAALMFAGIPLKSQSPQYYTARRLYLELTTPAPKALVT